MGDGTALRRLGEFLEECERAHAVESVGLAAGIDRAAAGRLSTEVEVTLPRAAGGSTQLCATSLNADGTVRFGFETTGVVVPQTEGVAVEPAGATVDPDGPVCLTLSVSVPTAGDGETVPGSGDCSTVEPFDPDAETVGVVADASGDGTSGEEDSGDEPFGDDDSGDPPTSDSDLPPFKNPQLLGEVYESCETFAEMAEALEMDVTAETVRRYMIDFGIHEPNSYDTGSEASEDPEDVDEHGDPDDAAEPDEAEGTPPVLSDGIGLPEEITVETLIETVERSNTIYEVKRDLGVAREDALEVLRECNLLDLVMCRLATEAERDITREDVVDRLRTASEAG